MPIVVVSPRVHAGAVRGNCPQGDRRKNPVESPADRPVEGLLAHIAGQGESTFRVVDVWESEEALKRFAEILVRRCARPTSREIRRCTPR